MPSEDLLHMLPSNSSMNQAREVLQEQLSRRMEELEELLDWAGQGSIDNG
jgi:LPS O-antigen subunit length determinant protein (WzzB/FepE family)